MSLGNSIMSLETLPSLKPAFRLATSTPTPPLYLDLSAEPTDLIHYNLEAGLGAF